MSVVAEKKRSDQESRWSVRRKTDAVMRLRRGEDLDTVARELRIDAHRLAAWRVEFIAGGAEALKARPADPTDRKLREAEGQIGRLTMELGLWQAAGGKGGSRVRRGSGRDERRGRANLRGALPSWSSTTGSGSSSDTVARLRERHTWRSRRQLRHDEQSQERVQGTRTGSGERLRRTTRHLREAPR
jgi:hypothetical protein